MSRSQTRAGCGTPRRPGGLRRLGQVAGRGRESSRKGSVGQHLLQAPLCLRQSSSLAEVARAPLSPHLTRELRGSISRGELGGSMSGGSSTFTGSLAARLPLRAATHPRRPKSPSGESAGARGCKVWPRVGEERRPGHARFPQALQGTLPTLGPWWSPARSLPQFHGILPGRDPGSHGHCSPPRWLQAVSAQRGTVSTCSCSRYCSVVGAR